MYDAFSSDYDRFVNWDNRLAVEIPFLINQLKILESETGTKPRILDAACGTGKHSIRLAQAGYIVAGADLSEKMVVQARKNAELTGVQPLFIKAGFEELAESFQKTQLFPFDALFCLGNSLPHVPDLRGLTAALMNFAMCLRPGGLLLIQNRNFNAVVAKRLRWMEPQAHREKDQDWVFLRFYDFLENGLIQFNIVTLQRSWFGEWEQSIFNTYLYPLRQEELAAGLTEIGFEQLEFFGSLSGEAYNVHTSGNLVITARAKRVSRP